MSESTTRHDEQRKSVSEDYARVVQNDAAKECCGKPVPKGVVAKLAGYTDAEFATLPAEAVTNAFGCGNPVAFSAVMPGDVVLDLGSGAGIDLLLAAKKVGAEGKVIGVDMTDAMIEQARKNVLAAGLTNVEVRKGIIEDLPVDSGSVDWVISNCVINLSPEKTKVFAEIARVLKPGGRMLVSDIVAEDLPRVLSSNAQLYSSCLAGAISEPAYLDGLRQAGLVNVEVKGRIVYDATQIEDFIGSELVETPPVTDCCGGCGGGGHNNSLQTLAKHWAPKLTGKVASVQVAAQKPNT